MTAVYVALFVACGGGGSGLSIFDYTATPTPTAAFVPTGSMAVARQSQRSNKLLDGTILVTGGFSAAGTAVQAAEIYNPNGGVWNLTQTQPFFPRALHAADLFSAGVISGQVLVAGGQNNNAALNTAELYNPLAGSFSQTTSLNTARYSAADAALTDGSNTALDAGGNNSFGLVPTAELFVPGPSSLGELPVWLVQTSQLVTPRQSATTTNLQTSNAAVLIAGGLGGAGGSTVLDAAELYVPDPTTLQGQFTSTGNMTVARVGQAATLISQGVVLITGGTTSNGTYLNTAEIYNASSGTFTAVTATMINARAYHQAVLLPSSNQVLIAGGVNNTGIISYVELFDISSSTFVPLSTTYPIFPNMIYPRRNFTADLLNNNTVLAEGGLSSLGATNTAELYP